MLASEPPENSQARFSLAKSWRKSLFEFLMLFLAVFLGFVAENLRENFAEKQQANELAKSFYEELKRDSVMVAIKVQNRLKKENSIKYLRKYFADSSLTHVSKRFTLHFFHGVVFRTPSIFEARTVVLDQLKNSGALRYFKNPELKKLIGDLSISISSINDRQELESYFFREQIQPIITNHLDFEFEERIFEDGKDVFTGFAKYEASNKVIAFTLRNSELLDRSSIVSKLAYFEVNAMMSTRTVPIQNYIALNTALLKELRNEFNLK
jgi:hypothetical protein